jgi:hypothetical protein
VLAWYFHYREMPTKTEELGPYLMPLVLVLAVTLAIKVGPRTSQRAKFGIFAIKKWAKEFSERNQGTSNLGLITLAIAIMLASIIHALSSRYVVVKETGRGQFNSIRTFDRWTGSEKFRP